MERCNERMYLEALQQRLESELGQLTEMLRQLPHRRAMLEGTHNVDRAPGLRKDSVSVIIAMVCNMIRDVSHGFLCTVLRVLNAQSTVLEEVSLRGRQVQPLSLFLSKRMHTRCLAMSCPAMKFAMVAMLVCSPQKQAITITHEAN